MFSTHKTVRVLALGFGAGVLGLMVQACSGVSSENDDAVKVGGSEGVEPSCDPTISRYCTTTTFTPKLTYPVTCNPKTQACPPADARIRYSVCQDVGSLYPSGGADIGKVPGNSRLVPFNLETMSVPCASIDKREKATCKINKETTPYFESKEVQGTGYLLAGGAISLDGSKDSPLDYIPVTPVTINTKDPYTGYVPCVPAGGYDTAGTPAGTELAGACVVESLNTAYNATGLPDANFATIEVCTTSYPHPDGIGPSREYWSGSYHVYCYKGQGAAVNDRNGTERDAYGYYLGGAERCHVTWDSGYEAPVAKRPSTITYPAPGKVTVTSPTVWRYVTSVAVANP